jgi:hypothetical protein
MGIVWRNRFEEDSKVDGLIIRTPRRRRSEVYITRVKTQFIGRLQHADRDRVGNDVCHSGATSGPRCGKLVRTNIDVRVDGVLLREQREFRPYEGSGIRNLCQGGDSGAPVYFGRVAKGIVSSIAGDNRRCFYSHIDHAFRALVTGTG